MICDIYKNKKCTKSSSILNFIFNYTIVLNRFFRLESYLVFSTACFLSSNISILRLTVHWFMYKKIALCLYFTLFLGLLTACNPKEMLRLEKNESSAQDTSQKSNQTLKNTNISAPIALPPSFGNRPLKPGQTQTEYMPNGLPALRPMKGINADTLFSENIKNSDDRFNRAENAIVDLRKEFDTYKPAIIRLAAVESDIQNLIKELEVLLQETPANQHQNKPINLINSEPQLQVAQLDPQPKPPPEQEEIARILEQHIPPPKAAPPPQRKTSPPKKSMPKYDGIIAKNLRAGEHADKIRIVIDTNKRTDFNIDLDNEEKLIIIEMPNARWISNNDHIFKASKLLESYSVEPINNGNGSMIVLSLKKGTTILREKRLSPDSSNPYQRIYFDLKI